MAPESRTTVPAVELQDSPDGLRPRVILGVRRTGGRLVINLKTARAPGLTILQPRLTRAHEVIR